MKDLLTIHPDVAARFPTYHALVLVAHDLDNGPSDTGSEALLRDAEEHVRRAFTGLALPDHPHIAAWREAYRAFGVKPQRTLNSAEALIARVLRGGELPRVNRLVDAYNAVSARFVVPCGGEDLEQVVGRVTLRFASGTEAFDTMKDGSAIIDHPAPGEVVWADERGVTCRAWNWRQGTRTRLTEGTKRAYFLFDALAPMAFAELDAAGDALERMLGELSPGCRLERVRIASGAV
ncbi:DNA/RNA-binding domain of Phe-tRNA-synthetase-like protein [Deinobacterium chartae]|uniref:DNA/RNA-binding domain of Phe-tRNA-synthetase-like protein n=1 Tax=Deinobacterium chartae TaxID=521158 RepID=A0A841I2S2_9DEIO|nr:phenylalanine--tRNA ligase beta subunit-related protein [Deinobacterium chartae]MBB6099977.1 DNA/RNA-binding domain of Phe-tRNA-synthetase-like protein [Deinobacterium chartae]